MADLYMVVEFKVIDDLEARKHYKMHTSFRPSISFFSSLEEAVSIASERGKFQEEECGGKAIKSFTSEHQGPWSSYYTTLRRTVFPVKAGMHVTMPKEVAYYCE